MIPKNYVSNVGKTIILDVFRPKNSKDDPNRNDLGIFDWLGKRYHDKFCSLPRRDSNKL